jgi:hypothetical protein
MDIQVKNRYETLVAADCYYSQAETRVAARAYAHALLEDGVIADRKAARQILDEVAREGNAATTPQDV